VVTSAFIIPTPTPNLTVRRATRLTYTKRAHQWGSCIIRSVSYGSDWQLPKFSDLMYTEANYERTSRMDELFLDRAPDGDLGRLLPCPTLKQGQCHDTVSPNLVQGRPRACRGAPLDVAAALHVHGLNGFVSGGQTCRLRNRCGGHFDSVRRILHPYGQGAARPCLDRDHGHRDWRDTVDRRYRRSGLWLVYRPLTGPSGSKTEVALGYAKK
jgi:hypothetical protein